MKPKLIYMIAICTGNSLLQLCTKILGHLWLSCAFWRTAGTVKTFTLGRTTVGIYQTPQVLSQGFTHFTVPNKEEYGPYIVRNYHIRIVRSEYGSIRTIYGLYSSLFGPVFRIKMWQVAQFSFWKYALLLENKSISGSSQ